MLFFIYDLLLLLFIFISSPFLAFKLFKKNELSLWKYRLGILSSGDIRYLNNPVWFHAASVGEVNGIYPIIDSLFRKNNNLEFVVTTYTAAGLKRAKEMFSGYPVRYFSILPLDISFIIKRFIKRINPQIIVISETELWPNLICQAKKQGIKVVMVNGRISDSSWQKYLSFRFFFKKIVTKIDFYCAQTGIDKNRLISLGIPSKLVAVTGNAKYSFMPVTEKDISILISSPVIVAGSTRPGEEEIILEAFNKFMKKSSRAMLVIAPRHLERIPEVEKMVRKTGISYMLRSKYLSNKDVLFTIIILDTLGELTSFYKLSDISFVGGTLKPFEGHNILEPAAFNKPVLFGPYINNVKEAAEDLIKSGGGRKVYNAKDLEQAFNEILSDEGKNRTMGEKAFFVFKKHKQSAIKQAETIEKILNSKEKILIIRFSSIGDIVLTSPVIRAVRNKYPESFISMLIKEEFAPLIADCPYLNEVIIFKKNDSVTNLVNRLKENKYDIIIDIHHNIRSLYLDYTLSVKKRLIYKKNIFKRWLLLNLHLNFMDRNSGVIDSYFKVLRQLGIGNDNKGLEIWINQNDEQKALDFLKLKAENKKYLIGIAPFAHWETKCWPLGHYAKVIENIGNKIDCRFIIFGGPGEETKLGRIFNDMKNKPVIALGQLNLMAQAALIKKCDYFIGNDTGLMHIADAVNIPLITFFGPTVEEFGFAPLGKNSVVLSRGLKCRPCSLHGSNRCRKGTLECLTSITPDEVVNKVFEKIKDQ